MLDTIGSRLEQTASTAHRTCALGKFIGFGLTLEALWCYGEKAPEVSVASYLCTGTSSPQSQLCTASQQAVRNSWWMFVCGSIKCCAQQLCQWVSDPTMRRRRRRRRTAQLLPQDLLGFHVVFLWMNWQHKTPSKARMPLSSCKPLPLRCADELFYRYFHLLCPELPDLHIINLICFCQPTPPFDSSPGRAVLRAQSPVPAQHPHGSQAPPCRAVCFKIQQLHAPGRTGGLLQVHPYPDSEGSTKILSRV